MTKHLGTYIATIPFFTIGVLAAAAPRANSGGNCPFDGDYVACLQAGKGVDYCKEYVLNCSGETCDYLIDETLEPDCPFPGSYLKLEGPTSITSKTTNCPYDGYFECLVSEEHFWDETWCKQNQLTCEDVGTTTAIVPLQAECGPFSAEGTIAFSGNPETIGKNYCLHVTSYEYTGSQSGTVEKHIDEKLKEKNPDCNNQAQCVCMPSSCL